MDENENAIKERLKKLIHELAKFLPDPSKVSADLWKFAKTHDRRAYQLMRFCFAADSDYRTVNNAIKEFSKRIDSSLKDTLIPLLYRTSLVLYNRGHIPAILDYSRTNDKGLSSIAHEVLTDVSSRIPEVLKTQVKEICERLQDDAPSAAKENSPDVVNDLKACASFAKKFPKEIPQDRKFDQAMANFALFGSPPATAKHAISIIMSASKKKEMFAKDLAQRCAKGLDHGKPGFLARLAAISRLLLLAPRETEGEADKIVEFAIGDVLLKNLSSSTASGYQWSHEESDECAAKCWAVRLLVNRVRSDSNPSNLGPVVQKIYHLLSNLVEYEGELPMQNDTPGPLRSRLRLLVARSFLKMSQSKRHDALFSPRAFHKLAEVAQDTILEVREPFLARLRKYLSRNTLPARFYTIPFLLAYEPNAALKSETMTWLKSRATILNSYQSSSVSTSKEADSRVKPKHNTVLENVFPRLLSLLAHHPDYEDEAPEMIEMSQYIVFYLSTVASDKNISLIYHIAQRVKASKDMVGSGSATETDLNYTKRLHALSDLATYTTRAYLEARNWSLQSLPGRVSLPSSLFGEIKDHDASMSVATKNFLLDGVEEGVDSIIRQSMRKGVPITSLKKKRKNESEAGTLSKKAKFKNLPTREKEKQTPKKTSKRKAHDWDDESEGDGGVKKSRTKGKATNGSARRKSGRTTLSAARQSYRERDDSEDDAEMEEANEDEELEDEDDNEQVESEENAHNETEDSEEEQEQDDAMNGDDVEMADTDAEKQEEMEEVQTPSPPPKVNGRKKKPQPVVQTPRRVSSQSLGSRLESSPANPSSETKSSPGQASKAQTKGKKAAGKVVHTQATRGANGRITRSRG